MMIHELIGLDFETYGAVSLPDHGLERYVADKTFMPLLASTAQYRDGTRNVMHRNFDFVQDYYESARGKLLAAIEGKTIVAHNAGFEQRVLRSMNIDLRSMDFIDSAVVARAAGAGGRLEAAAPQLLGVDKMEEGKTLMRLFSIPTKEKLESGDLAFDPQVVVDHPAEWAQYLEYCQLDAYLGLRIVTDVGLSQKIFSEREHRYQAVTMDMNQLGWPVDIEKVEEMQRRYLENQAVALENFRSEYGAEDLNLNSLKQLKEWCAKRGIKASSFDETNVEKLAARIDKKLDAIGPDDVRAEAYHEVLMLLRTKQIMGGSSLKKLQVILDTVGENGRLTDQYLHIGAGQSWRTTGRSVQM